MERLSFLKNIDWKNHKVKAGITLVVTLLVSIILTPGFLFEYKSGLGFQKVNKIDGKTASLHSLFLAIIVTLLYYFYLRKQ